MKNGQLAERNITSKKGIYFIQQITYSQSLCSYFMCKMKKENEMPDV